MNLPSMLSTFCFVPVLFLLKHHATAQSADSAECKCVPDYLCNQDNITTQGESAIDIRVRRYVCPNYLHICCKKDRIKPYDMASTSNQTPCGIRNSDGIGFRITNTNGVAQYGEFPWMVAISVQDEKSNNYRPKCGGSLIHPRVVLTATQCVNYSGTYMARVGEWDTQTKKELYPHQDVKVEEIIKHPNYDAHNLYNDISLLILEFEVSLSYDVNLACLPPHSYVASGNGCFVTGWGKNKFGKDGVYQIFLKKIELPIIGRSTCQKAISSALGKEFNLHKTFICAGGEKDKDACTGDEGGPLVCPISGKKDRYQQVGIVSWGIGCKQEGVPRGYVDVATFRNWIDDNLRQRNLSNTVYTY